MIATFGEGYFQRGNRGVNPCAVFVPRILPNVHMMDAQHMTSSGIRTAGVEETIKWLVSPGNESTII